MRGLAYRRHALDRTKARVKGFKRFYGRKPDAALIGKTAATPHVCSGYCCGNQRRYSGHSMQERRAPQLHP